MFLCVFIRKYYFGGLYDHICVNAVIGYVNSALFGEFLGFSQKLPAAQALPPGDASEGIVVLNFGLNRLARLNARQAACHTVRVFLDFWLVHGLF